MERRYTTGIISAMLTMLAVALITGLALMPVYNASANMAHQSVVSISASGFLGFLRSLHHWSSAMLIVLGVVFIVAGLFGGAYRKPGQWLWLGTIAMFLIGLGMQITGHLLPYDQQAVRTAVVETGIAANAPVIGDAQGNLMRGGTTVGPATLHLWYMAHVTIFLLVGVLLLFAIPKAARKLDLSLDRRVWIIGSFAILLALCITLHPPLGIEAGPGDMSDQGAKPEWYILALHSLLVLAQNIRPNLAFVGTMVIPGIAMLALVALPWIRKAESPGVSRALGIIAALGIAGLFFYSIGDVAPIVGDQIPRTPVDAGYPGSTSAKLDPTLIAEGRKLFVDQGCGGCHKVNGAGGKIGPDLSAEGAKKRGVDWHIKHIQDPKSTSPGSTMPKFDKLPGGQLTALGEYLESLGK